MSKTGYDDMKQLEILATNSIITVILMYATKSATFLWHNG